MANRTMEVKRIKLKRQRRAWAKNYRQRNFRVPNREVIKEYKHHANGIPVDEAAIDAFIILDQIKHNHPNPGVPKMDGVGRKAALKRQAELESKLPDGCDLRFTGPSVPDMYQETFIYFNARRTKFVLVLRDLEHKIERMSYVFSSKETLVFAWEQDMVRWENQKPIA